MEERLEVIPGTATAQEEVGGRGGLGEPAAMAAAGEVEYSGARRRRRWMPFQSACRRR